MRQAITHLSKKTTRDKFSSPKERTIFFHGKIKFLKNLIKNQHYSAIKYFPLITDEVSDTEMLSETCLA